MSENFTTPNELYFNWLCDRVDITNRGDKSYFILAESLHRKQYYWTLANDDNRAYDGWSLRNTFYQLYKDTRLDLEIGPWFLSALDGPCSVFEMMVALSIRCENEIMLDKKKGNRTAEWFWTMIRNLHLEDCDDVSVTEEHVNRISDTIHRALDREYDEYGHGAFWTVENPPKSMKELEIWFQMTAYLRENYPEEFHVKYVETVSEVEEEDEEN